MCKTFAMTVHKLIITNKTALLDKYGPVRFKRIEKGLQKLVTFDQKRKLTARVVYLDNNAMMKKYKSTVVVDKDAADEVKKAVDELYDFFQPDYIVLLGAPDIIPHVNLQNLLHDEDPEEEEFVPSDLPYACDARYSKVIGDFMSPSRVVGRLPDINGGKDEKYLLQLITNITLSGPQDGGLYQQYFALSAKAWTGASKKTLLNVVGDHSKLLLSPTRFGKFTAAEMKPRLHLFNCHGASNDPAFYGQASAKSAIPDTPAFESKLVPGKITFGTVAAAECCYGGELYDPAVIGVDNPTCNNYLLHGALAYVGSTTIAYGSFTDQESADYIARFFLRNVVKGFSVGRAFLDARQRFLEVSAPDIDPVELKTVAQFLLLGDPSVHPVINTEGVDPKVLTAKTAETTATLDHLRKKSRLKMKEKGKSLGAMMEVPEKKTKKPSKVLQTKLDTILKARNFNPGNAATYDSTMGKKAATAKAAGSGTKTIRVYFDSKKKGKIKQSEILVVKSANDQILEVNQYVRK
jgi:Peptidase family C25